MVAELEDLDRQITAIVKEVTSLTTGLSEQQAHWTPSPSTWAVGQCLDHISISVRQYLPGMDAAIRKGRERGMQSNGPFHYGLFGRWLVRNIEPPPKFRAKTGRAFIPQLSRRVEEIAADFFAAHEELRQRLRQSDGLDLARLKMPHPALPLMRFSLGVGFGILTGHARRHIWQARQIIAQPGFPH